MSFWEEYKLIRSNGDVFGEECGNKLINCPRIPVADKRAGRPILIANIERGVAFVIDPNTKVILRKILNPKNKTTKQFEAFLTKMVSRAVPPKTKQPNPSPWRTKL